MNKYQKVAKNTLLIAIGTIGSKLIYLLMLPLYTRWLTTDEYGASDTITIYTDILITILFLNIADSIFVYPKMAATLEAKKDYFSSGFAFILIMAIFGGALFFVLDFFPVNIIQFGVFYKYRWLIFALMLSRYLQMFFQDFSRSLDKLGIYSASGVLLTGGIALFSFLLIPSSGVYGYVLAIILAQLTSAAFTFFAAREVTFFSFRNIKKQPLKELLSYSIPLAPNSIMWWLINGINRPMMEAYLGLAAIGLYAVASRISGVINSISSIFSIAWSNSVLEEYGKEGFKTFYNNYMRIMAIVYFLGCMLLVVLSKPLVSLFTTPEYYDASMLIPFMALGLCFSSMASNVGAVFSAVKKSKYFFYGSLWGGAMSVASLLVLMPLCGLIGTAISLALSFLTILIVRWVYAIRFVKIYDIKLYFLLVFAFFAIYLNTLYVGIVLGGIIDVLIFVGLLYYFKSDIKKMMTLVAIKKNKKG